MIEQHRKIIYETCPNCGEIVKNTELVQVMQGKKLLGFLPIPSRICKFCIAEHNQKVRNFRTQTPKQKNVSDSLE